MEHEHQKQDSWVEQHLRESSLHREDTQTSSPLAGDIPPQQLIKTDSAFASDPEVLALHHADWKKRVQAVQNVKGSKKPLVREHLIMLLNDREAVVRIAAIQALGALGAEAPVNELLSMLDDADWTVRETSVLTLGTLGDSVPARSLFQALYDEQKFVREAAIHALKGRLPIAIVIADLVHRDAEIRASAARILGELEEPSAVQPLINAIHNDPQSTVRRAAILAFGQMEIPLPVNPLKDALQFALQDSDQDVREAAEIVLEAKGMHPVPYRAVEVANPDTDTHIVLRPPLQGTNMHHDVPASGEGYRANTFDRGETTNYAGRRFGSYILTKVIGEGGRAIVYLGEHIFLKTQAAVKVLKVHLPGDELEGFINEAKMVANLKHPAIVRVLDFGVESGVPFLVMDYAPQGNLRQRYSSNTQVPLLTLVPIIKQVAGALQYAHNNGVIHKDVKPENILIGSDDVILLSDFGIAQLERNPANPYQNEDKITGTLPYIAPEQWWSEPCYATDQYALGVIAYELLSGRLPFEGSTLTAVMKQHLKDSPPSLRQYVSGLSSQIEHVVLRALAKTPERRFSSVQAFADALDQAASSKMPLDSGPVKKYWLRISGVVKRLLWR